MPQSLFLLGTQEAFYPLSHVAQRDIRRRIDLYQVFPSPVLIQHRKCSPHFVDSGVGQLPVLQYSVEPGLDLGRLQCCSNAVTKRLSDLGDEAAAGQTKRGRISL
jgi:hypothetical protein